jgi:hypothetical protein
VDGVRERTEVTVRFLFTWKIVLDFGLALIVSVPIVIVLALLVPGHAAVLWGWLALVIVMWAALWLRTSVRFTEHDLSVTMWLWPRRVPWEHVRSVSFVEEYDHEAEEVVRRRIQIRYPRGSRQPVSPMPTRLGDAMEWSRTNFRTLPVPIAFPPPGEEPAASRTWVGRSIRRKRQIVRREFAARGYPLPD